MCVCTFSTSSSSTSSISYSTEKEFYAGIFLFTSHHGRIALLSIKMVKKRVLAFNIPLQEYTFFSRSITRKGLGYSNIFSCASQISEQRFYFQGGLALSFVFSFFGCAYHSTFALFSVFFFDNIVPVGAHGFFDNSYFSLRLFVLFVSFC